MDLTKRRRRKAHAPSGPGAQRWGRAPGGVPALGHLPRFLGDPLAFMSSLPDYGELVDIRLAHLSIVVVCDPELTRQVLLDDRTFDKGGPWYARLREVIGDGLVACRHTHHRRRRHLIQPAFHQARMPGYSEAMAGQIDAVVGSWNDGDELDILTEMLTITTKIMMEALFSSSLGASVMRRTFDDCTTVLDGVYRRMLTPSLVNRLPTPDNRHYRQAITRLRREFGAIIAERRAEGTDRGELLSPLLSAQYPDAQGDDRELSDIEITDDLITFFLAGTETTAANLSWALYLISQHPDVEAGLHAETDAVLAGRPATHADLPHLELTHRIITEALRLYPPGWLFTRTVTTATHLGGHPIPAGTTLLYSPYLIQRRDDLYERPDRFDPDRWKPGPDGSTPPRHALIPFGGGGRKCIGDRFGIVEAVLTLATIASKWRIEPIPGVPMRPKASLTLHPKGLRMHVHTRPDREDAPPAQL